MRRNATSIPLDGKLHSRDAISPRTTVWLLNNTRLYSFFFNISHMFERRIVRRGYRPAVIGRVIPPVIFHCGRQRFVLILFNRGECKMIVRRYKRETEKRTYLLDRISRPVSRLLFSPRLSTSETADGGYEIKEITIAARPKYAFSTITERLFGRRSNSRWSSKRPLIKLILLQYIPRAGTFRKFIVVSNPLLSKLVETDTANTVE